MLLFIKRRHTTIKQNTNIYQTVALHIHIRSNLHGFLYDQGIH